MGIEQDPECRWDVLRIIFGDGFRDMFLNFTKTSFSTILFKTNMVIFNFSTQLCKSTELLFFGKIEQKIGCQF